MGHGQRKNGGFGSFKVTVTVVAYLEESFASPRGQTWAMWAWFKGNILALGAYKHTHILQVVHMARELPRILESHKTTHLRLK